MALPTNFVEDKRKKELKENIQFFINHLDNKELAIIEDLANMLAFNYSKSYQEWFKEANK